MSEDQAIADEANALIDEIWEVIEDKSIAAVLMAFGHLIGVLHATGDGGGMPKIMEFLMETASRSSEREGRAAGHYS